MRAGHWVLLAALAWKLLLGGFTALAAGAAGAVRFVHLVATGVFVVGVVSGWRALRGGREVRVLPAVVTSVAVVLGTGLQLVGFDANAAAWAVAGGLLTGGVLAVAWSFMLTVERTPRGVRVSGQSLALLGWGVLMLPALLLRVGGGGSVWLVALALTAGVTLAGTNLLALARRPAEVTT